jgi:hypothetical protein
MENPDNANNSAQPREPWNKRKLIGQKPPLRPKHVLVDPHETSGRGADTRFGDV